MKAKGVLSLFLIIVLMGGGLPAVAASDDLFAVSGSLAYSAMEDFNGGVAVARQDGKTGLVNAAGNPVAPFEGYTSLTYAGSDSGGNPFFSAVRDGKAALMGKDGTLRTDFVFSRISGVYGALAVAVKDGQTGAVYVSDGKEAVPFRYSEIASSDGGARFVARGGAGKAVLSDAGKTVVSAGTYDDITSFQGGYAVVRKNGLYGLIDSEGKLVVPVQYQSLELLPGISVLLARKDGQYGAVSESGKTVIPFSHTDGKLLSNGAFAMMSSGKLVLYRQDGTVIAGAGAYADAIGAVGNLVILRKNDFSCGAVSIENGKEIIPFDYDSVGEIQHGLCQMTAKSGEMAVFNSSGKVVLPPKAYGLVTFRNDGTILVTFSSGKWGLFDSEGNEILPYNYYSIGTFNGHYVVASNENGYAVYDRYGQVVIDFGIFDWISFAISDRRVVVMKDGKYGCVQLGAGADAPSNWAVEEVNAAISNGLIPKALQEGYQQNIKRIDFCRLVVQLVERWYEMDIDSFLNTLSTVKPAIAFSDTADKHVMIASRLGIINGKGNGIFDPEGLITRQDAATMLYRTAQLLRIESGTPAQPFADEDQFAGYAVDAIYFISSVSDAQTGRTVMGGVGSGRFSPLGYYTREQAYLTMIRLYRS